MKALVSDGEEVFECVGKDREEDEPGSDGDAGPASPPFDGGCGGDESFEVGFLADGHADRGTEDEDH